MSYAVFHEPDADPPGPGLLRRLVRDKRVVAASKRTKDCILQRRTCDDNGYQH